MLVAKEDGGIHVCLDPRGINVTLQCAYYQLPTVYDRLPLALILLGNSLGEMLSYFIVAECRIGLIRDGMSPDGKVRAIKEIPPIDTKIVERLIGAINYLLKFIPKYTQRLILFKTQRQIAFRELKEALGVAGMLVLHFMAVPGRAPIVFAFRTLPNTQR